MHAFQRRKGQGLLEFAIILSLVAVVIVAVLAIFGTQVSSVYCQVVKGFGPAACTMGGGVVVSGDGNGNMLISCRGSYTLAIDGLNPGGGSSSLGSVSCSRGSNITYPVSGHHGWTITVTDTATGNLMGAYAVP
jgi:pilus assembly protein Flp/PilA